MVYAKEQWSLIHCDYVKTSEIYGVMTIENDNKHMNERKCYKWVNEWSMSQDVTQ
jgi:hypothetical protein